MRTRFMTYTLNDDLYVAGRRHELNKVATRIRILRQRVAQRGAPKPGRRQKIIGLTINDDISKSASMHWRPSDA